MRDAFRSGGGGGSSDTDEEESNGSSDNGGFVDNIRDTASDAVDSVSEPGVGFGDAISPPSAAPTPVPVP